MTTRSTNHPEGKRATYDPEGLARLCASYDALFAAGAGLDEEQAVELLALARIFDIDAEKADAGTWKAVEAVLRQDGRRLPQKAHRVSSKTILIVEDDPDVAEDITTMFTEAGHQLVGPFHAAEAAEIAASLHQIDLAVVDINLSGEASGVDLARTLGRLWGIPVIFLSGDEVTAKANLHLATAFVAKPFKAADLLEAVANADPSHPSECSPPSLHNKLTEA